jgi:hypothetical protein
MQFGHFPLAGSVVVAVVLQFASPVCLSAADGEGESWRERFLTEAPRKWDEYRSRMDRFQATVSRTSTYHRSNGTTIEKGTAAYKQNRAVGCFLSDAEGESHFNQKHEKTPRTLRATNSRYRFELIYAPTEDRWYLMSWKPARIPDSSRVGTTAPAGTPSWANDALAFNTSHAPISNLISHPGFKVMDVTRLEKDGKVLARVEIDFRPEREDELKYSKFRKGWALFDPRRSWVLVEYDGSAEQDQGQGTMHGSYEYASDPGGFPLLKRKVITYTGKDADGQPLDFVKEDQFDLKEGDAPESEFHLSAYGLPEPDLSTNGPPEPVGVEPKKALPTYLWVLLGAAVGAAATLGIRSLARRQRSSAG